jgi:opacity protein-like surface antigen
MSTTLSSRRTRFAAGLALGLLCLAATVGARAQSATLPDEGFYLGVGFGPSTFDQNKQEFDAGVFGSFTDAGFTVLNPVSKLDDSSTEFHGLVGYRFNPNFGFELAFVDIGKLNYSATMTLAGGGLPSPSPGSISGDLSAKGPVLSVFGSVPLRKRWEVFGRLGLFYADTTLGVAASVLNVSSSSSISARSTDTVLGIGGAFNLSRRFSIRLEYQKLKDVGDPDRTGEGDVDVIDLGLLIRLY